MSVTKTNSNQGPSNIVIKFFIKEGEQMLKASKKCEELWAEMRKADFRQEGFLNEKSLCLIYENKCKVLEELLKISTVEEFLDVFDDDMDGLLNEDEQILVFSIIKERIKVIAEEICYMKKYDLYKDLMKEVRNIETQIVKYQNCLRENVHKHQLHDYINIGEEIRKDFESKWNFRFHSEDEQSIKEVTQKELLLKSEKEENFNCESSKINQIKLRPSNKLRILHNQERLVAINERIEEAANYRNEIRQIERKDEIRLKKLNDELFMNLRKDLERKEKMELKKVKDKLMNDRNKSLITKNKQTIVLNKQINLHVNDIIRIQNQLSNIYIDIAKKKDELIRTRERQKQTNLVLSSFKSTSTSSMNMNINPAFYLNSKRELAMALLNLSSKPISLNISMESNQGGVVSTSKKHLIALKYMIKNLRPIHFDINGDFVNRKFCNVTDDGLKNNVNSTLKRKIKKLLDQRKHQDEVYISPTLYYDDNLNIVLDAKDYKDVLPKVVINK